MLFLPSLRLASCVAAKATFFCVLDILDTLVSSFSTVFLIDVELTATDLDAAEELEAVALALDVAAVALALDAAAEELEALAEAAEALFDSWDSLRSAS